MVVIVIETLLHEKQNWLSLNLVKFRSFSVYIIKELCSKQILTRFCSSSSFYFVHKNNFIKTRGVDLYQQLFSEK